MRNRLIVDTELLYSLSRRLNTISDKLYDACLNLDREQTDASELIEVKDDLRLKVIPQRIRPDTADQRLKSTQRALAEYADFSRRLGRALRNVAEAYEDVEGDLLRDLDEGSMAAVAMQYQHRA